jgi:hypothetical protein
LNPGSGDWRAREVYTDAARVQEVVVTRSTAGVIAFVLALLFFGAAVLLPDRRTACVILGAICMIATIYLRPAPRRNKW